jgi:hypothetical protein
MIRRFAWVPLLAAALGFLPAERSIVDRLRYDVYFLASDALEGRRTGSTGARVAADFIAKRFTDIGLTPEGDSHGYTQRFSFISGVKPGGANRLELSLNGGKRLATANDEFRPLAFSTSGAAEGELVFAGYGIHAPDLGYDDYAGLDVKGKVLLVLRFSPDGDDPSSRFQPYMALRRKAADARQLGASAILIATGPVAAPDTAPVKLSFDASFADSGLPALSIATGLAEEVFAGQGFSLGELQQRINDRKEPASRPLGIPVSLAADVIQEHADGNNVLALLPGTSAALRDELVIVGAHFDHLGRGGEGSGSLAAESTSVHNGADDNASGVAGMLEIARRLSLDRPARSVLFVAFAGEEIGLLGSQHLVQHLPVPRDKVVAMLNLDMIGRPKEGPSLTLGGFGTAAEWPEVLEAANEGLGVNVQTNKGGFGASDHSSFYGADIPVLFFFTGAHEDYHKPSDDASRLDYPAMSKIVELAAAVAKQVADRPQRPTFQRVAEEEGGGRRGYKVRTGVIPEFGYDGPGFKISGVRGGSPGDKAGMKAGDVVVRFGEREIRNIYDYMYALGDHQPGETVTLEIQRDGRTLEVAVTLEPGGAGGR